PQPVYSWICTGLAWRSAACSANRRRIERLRTRRGYLPRRVSFGACAGAIAKEWGAPESHSGSNTAKVARAARCCRRLLVPIDGMASNSRAPNMQHVSTLSRQRCKLTLMEQLRKALELQNLTLIGTPLSVPRASSGFGRTNSTCVGGHHGQCGPI